MTVSTMAVTMSVFLRMAVSMTIRCLVDVTFLLGRVRSSMAVPMTHVSKQQHSNLQVEQ